MYIIFLLIILIISLIYLLFIQFFIKPIKTIKSYPLESIEKYLINLDKRTDRLHITTKLLNDHGFTNIIRYPAVNGKEISSFELEKLVAPHAINSIKQNQRTEHHQLSYGAVGCSLSHINIWKEFNNSTSLYSDMIMIFEDDVLPSFTITDLHKYLEYVPEDWDILFLGALINKGNTINNVVSKINKFYCMHSYIIRKKCIPFLLKHAFPLEKQIDSWLSDLANENKINMYTIIKDNYWKQNNEISNTDIQTLNIKDKLLNNKNIYNNIYFYRKF